MRDLYQNLILINFLFICINLGFYFIGNAFTQPTISGKSLNFTTLNSDSNSTVQGFQGGGGFNTAFIFGDFGKAITVFMNLISGGYVVNTLTVLGFPDYFVIPFQAILGIGTVVSLIYLVSGRW